MGGLMPLYRKVAVPKTVAEQMRRPKKLKLQYSGASATLGWNKFWSFINREILTIAEIRKSIAWYFYIHSYYFMPLMHHLLVAVFPPSISNFRRRFGIWIRVG